MAEIGARELLLLLIGIDPDEGRQGTVNGITRLQKLLFLLQQEGHVTPRDNSFEFVPYKAGPYSSKLYDDLELLENLQLIRTEATAESTPAESADIDKLNFEDLMGGLDADLDGVSKAADSFEERRFTLTEKGRERVEKLLQVEGLQSVTNGIRSIKSRFSKHSLRDLLKYVYTKYPGMTTESEIIDKVLGRRKR